MGAAAPAVPVFGAVVDQQQDATGRHALDQAVEQGLGLAVDPVQVLEDQGERLALAFAHEQRLEAVQRPSSPLGRVERLPGGVLDRQLEQGQQRRQDRLQRLVQHQDLAQNLLGVASPVVAGCHVEVGLEQIDDRGPGAGAPRGHRGALQGQPRAHPGAVGQLVEQPRLAHTRIADQGDDLALSGRGQLARPLQRRQLALAADEGREPAPGCRLETRARRADARQIERLDRLRQALHRHLPQGPQVQEAFGEAGGRRGQPDRSGARQLLHPAREVDGRADRVVVHAEVVADRAHQDLARMQADPRADLEAMALAHPLGLARHRLLDRERGIAGAHRVVLVGDRRPEQGHDAVAQHLVHDALVTVHRGHHGADRGIQDLASVLGVQGLDQGERTLDVGEQHGDLLALALEGGARAEDALGQIAGGVGLGRRIGG